MRVLILAASLIAATAALAQTPQTQPPASRTPSSASTTTGSSAKPALIDINSASPQELQQLKGIGDARAEAIVKGRPYKGKDDLVQKKILTKSVYDGIKDQIIARQH
jgi:DNA uptake protein ComE-like DNA-binding protein